MFEIKNKIRVLVYHNSSLGDTMVALPAFKLIRRRHPNAIIVLMSSISQNLKSSSPESIIGPLKIFDEFLFFGGKSNKFDTFKTIRKKEFDILYYLNERRNLYKLLRDFIFFKIAACKKTIGINFDSIGYSFLAKDNLYENITQFIINKTSLLKRGSLIPRELFDLEISDVENVKIKSLLKKMGYEEFISVSIGTKNDVNDWGYKNWAEFLTKLIDCKPQLKLIFVGAQSEHSTCDRLGQLVAPNFLNFCGSLNIRESAALIGCSSLFIGHDSGPIHLAHSVSTPFVGIYSSRNLPGVWFPAHLIESNILYKNIECMGCEKIACITKNKRCILSITPDEVLEHVLRKLEKI